MHRIQTPQKIEQHPPLGIVLAHPDLLPDDPLLLFHRLLGEIGRLDKIEQDFQGFLEAVGTGKQIRRTVETGVGVGRRPGFGITGKGVAVLTLEQLVFEIMGESGRHDGRRGVPLAHEGRVDRTVTGGEGRVAGLVAEFWPYVDRKP